MTESIVPTPELSKAELLARDPRKVYGYLPVSTDQQQGGLASQALAVQNYFKREGIMSYQVFQNEGMSGSKLSRPALGGMMKLVGERQCKLLVVFYFSRFSRSFSHLLQMVEYLKKRQTQLVSISEAVNTQSSVGQALLAVLGILAQLERDLIRERVNIELARARSLGKHIGRVKTRPSELIRALLKSGMTLRATAREFSHCFNARELKSSGSLS